MLYSSNSKSFFDLLQASGYSRTYRKNNQWMYHYVFTYVLNRTVLRGENQFTTIHIGELDERLGRLRRPNGGVDRASKIILDELVAWDVLIRQYIHTKKLSSGKEFCTTRVDYKVNDTALVDGFEEWVVPGDVRPSPIEEITKTKPLTGIYLRLFENLRQLDFDGTGARAYAKNALNTQQALRDKQVVWVKKSAQGKVRVPMLQQGRYVTRRIYSIWLNNITKLEKRIWNEKSDEQKTKRFFTTLHSTPTVIRYFMTIGGKKQVEVDVSSSQCLMLAILLKRHYGQELPRDVAHYIELCETGEFYAYVQKLVGAQAMQREAFKQAFFARIFYSSERKNYQWRTRFAAEKGGFPTVSAFITLQKAGVGENSYKQFPVMLSALESEIMLEGIAARLLDEGITEFYTVHDAFYCTEDVRPRVKQVLAEVFDGYGVKAHVKEKKGNQAAVSATPPTIEYLMNAKLAELEAQFAVFETEMVKTADDVTLNAERDTMTDEERMAWTLNRLEEVTVIDLEWW